MQPRPAPPADEHRGLAALVDAAHDLAGAGDLEALLPVVARHARRLLGCALAFVAVLDDERAEFAVRAVDGLASGLAPGHRLPRDEGLAGPALRGSGPRWTSGADGSPAEGLPPAEGLRAVVVVRLGIGAGRFGQRPFGVLFAADRRPRAFTAGECALLASFAELAGAAIEKARLLERTVARLSGLENTTARTAARLGRSCELRAAHHALVDLAVAAGDPQDLVDEAARRLDAAVRLCDADGRALATGRAPGGDEDGAPPWPDQPAGPHREPRELDTGIWAVPALAGGRPLGTVLVRAERVLGAADRQLLPLVAQAAAVVLRQHAGVAVEEHARDDLLDDLLMHPPRSRRRLQRAAHRLRLDLDRPHVVLAARPETPDAAAGWAVSYVRRIGGVGGVRDGRLVVVAPGADPGAAARSAAEELSALLGAPVTVGAAGPVRGAAAVAAGHVEALRCLDALTALELAGRGASGRDLGFLGVLLSDRQGVDTFVDAVLGPVLDHDRRRFTELTRTLDAYFAASGSPTNAAERLHVHPNTVARRLERVKELLGPDWQRPIQALDLQLALRLFRLRDTLSGGAEAKA
ncbi:helix-turn-helix domain-containing protein [Dactylosporangium sp. NPDC000244]|uniref:helix-turn-helix domain-containing protein n=1 Tax=Dactylosporangium sp. NPDC000244 TaxID=3154365 RepID=UPI003325CEB2